VAAAPTSGLCCGRGYRLLLRSWTVHGRSDLDEQLVEQKGGDRKSTLQEAQKAWRASISDARVLANCCRMN
jgi:hypothetical protein